MKKFILATAVMLSAAQCAIAQSYGEDKPFFGMRLGLDITSASGDLDIYSNSAGFEIGAVYAIPLGRSFYFEPGLHLFYNRMGIDVEVAEPSGVHTIEYDGHLSNWGFRLPLNFGYSFQLTEDVSLQAFTGPWLNINIKMRNVNEFKENGVSTKESNGLLGDPGKYLDLQWGLGIGLTYNNRYTVNVAGGIGVTPMMSYSSDKERRNSFCISLGYNF